ncbi:amidohydrolase family protein [Mycolicibacterium arseniciresistens]|uniref:Amidohydrolase family protein n=1 Tax=Mycolicibacterium arseniciresistens TaxID=3062257 RepID=A0ABT8UHA5_9MYCO|nr:amidohydrolase family protein [Mycolicibacterium arseniciresistens]MDO3635564.1 amidohydrolase family protein [Mycolicibacterium arseniciresistens]
MTLRIPASPVGDGHTELRVITLEEHFTTPEFLAATAAFTPDVARSDVLEGRLLDLDDGRFSAMDAGGVDLQVMSLAAGGQESLAPADATALVRDANDAAFAATRRHPGRLAMFASLALKDADAAATELERGVRELACVGGFLNGTEGGAFLDDPRFTPIFEAAQHLDVPLYLHPTPPPPAVQQAYFGGLPERSAYFLSTAAWGWHAELGMHCLRLILAGVFDRFPGLRFIVGHMGENLPFSLIRAQDGLSPAVTGLQRPVAEYFLDHFVVTTSGYFTPPPLRCALDVMGVDRVLYSVDYPYRANTAGAELLRTAPVAVADLRKIASGNAERVLGLAAG